MTLTIKNSSNVFVDITPYIAKGGVKWQRADVEGTNAGRTLDGVMHRKRVTTKMRLDITCTPLTTTDANTLLNLIAPEYIYVTYTDPQLGDRVAIKMYSNNNPATFCMTKDNVDYWNGITFPLIEV